MKSEDEDSLPLPKERFNLRKFVFQARGPSGHSWFRKARFAMALFSPFAMMGSVGVAKDIYLEKFGLDATIFSLLVSIEAFWHPFRDIIMGRLQDKEVLSRFFPVERWGRRAPWLLTHCIMAMMGASVIYLPPAGNFAYAWYLIMWIVTTWGIAGTLISFEAARQQVYPYKEERISVEGLCKYSCMAGGGAGGLVFIVLSKDASIAVRLAFVLYIIPLGLISLEAVPLFKEAQHSREVHSAEDTAGILQILREALPRWFRVWLTKRHGGEKSQEKPDNRALQHLLAMKFWHGCYTISISSMLLYFVTYVLRLSSWDRVQVIIGAGLMAGVTEAVMNLVWVHLFTKVDSLRDVTGRSDRTLLYSVISLRLLNAVFTCLLIGFMQPSVFLMFVWCIITRIGLCSFSFFRVSAQCWLVDEDCLSAASAEDTSRRNMREGQIFGALSMSQVLAAALISSLSFVGLGLAGFQTKNCEAFCVAEGLAGDSDCVDACFRDVIDGQPQSLRMYVRFVMGIFAPLCELLISFHAFKFPIKNARLRKLYLMKAAERGEDIQPEQEAVGKPYASKSQIVLMDEAQRDTVQGGAGAFTSEFIDRLVYTVRMVQFHPSISVRFTDGESESMASPSRAAKNAKTSTLSSDLTISDSSEISTKASQSAILSL